MKMSMKVTNPSVKTVRMNRNMCQDVLIKSNTTSDVFKELGIVVELKDIMIALDQSFVPIQLPCDLDGGPIDAKVSEEINLILRSYY